MDVLPTNDFNFDELDLMTMNSLMKDGVDIFSQQNFSNDCQAYNEQDFIDEFLNLDQNKKNTGIFVESQCNKEEVNVNSNIFISPG